VLIGFLQWLVQRLHPITKHAATTRHLPFNLTVIDGMAERKRHKQAP
jgi:hypothetical protein